LEQLEQSFDASPQATEELENKITAKCIEFSKEKVKNYSRLLRKCVETLAGQTEQQGAFCSKSRIFSKGRYC
jgi:hypothetical protein